MKVFFGLLAIILMTGCDRMNTEYSRPDLPRRFSLIQVGDSVEKVYETLGAPLHIDVNDRGAFHPRSLEGVDILLVKQVLTNINKEVHMFYSRPKKGAHYLAYELGIGQDKVYTKVGPLAMD